MNKLDRQLIEIRQNGSLKKQVYRVVFTGEHMPKPRNPFGYVNYNNSVWPLNEEENGKLFVELTGQNYRVFYPLSRFTFGG